MSSTNIFQTLEKDLTIAQGYVTRVKSPLNDVSTDSQKILDFTNDIKSFKDGLSSLSDSISTIQTLIGFIGVIPGLEEVDALDAPLSAISKTVSDVSRAFSELEKTVIEPVRNVATKIHDIVQPLTNSINSFLNEVPKINASLVVLDWGYQIVSNLVPLLQGTEVSKKFSDLKDKYMTIVNDASTAFKPVLEGMKSVESAITDVTSVVKPIVSDVIPTLQTALNSIKSITSTLSSIKDTFDTIEDMLGPIKWAIEGVAKIFDKVVKPVINEIFKLTHLNDLIKPFVDQLTGALHLDDFMNQLKSLKISELQSAFEKFAEPADSISKWTKVKDSIKSLYDNPTQTVIYQLLSAIAGTSLSPDAVPPPLPPNPPLDDDSKLTPTISLVALRTTPRNFTKFNAIKPNKRKLKKVSLKSGTWDSFDEFVKQIDSALEDIATIKKTIQSIKPAIFQFQDQQQVTSFIVANFPTYKKFVNAIHDFGNFLGGFWFLTKVMKKVLDATTKEVSHIDTVATVVTQFDKSDSQISKSFSDLFSSDLDKMIDSIRDDFTSWKSVILRAKDLIECGFTTKNLDPKLKQELEDLREKFLKDIGSLSKILKTTFDDVHGIGSSCSDILSFCNHFSSQIQDLQKIEDRMKTSLVALDKDTNVISYVDAIFAPLTGLLQSLKCTGTDKDGIKSSQWNTAKSVAEVLVPVGVGVLDLIAEHFIPLNDLEKILHSYISLFKDSNVSGVIEGVQKSVKEIRSQLTPDKTYKFKDATINNFFFGDGDIAKINELIKKFPHLQDYK